MSGQSNNYYKTLFFSDWHLGSEKCKAERLYHFLKKNHANTIYLVGDIFDGHWDNQWPESHHRVLNLLMSKMLRGALIIFIPGNHDRVFRNHYGTYGSFVIEPSACYEMKDGRHLLVTHGDETDMIRFHWILKLILRIERWTNWHLWEILRRNLTSLIDRHSKKFEQKMIKLALGYAGVICGHIHKPNIINEGKFYGNPGDWTHHCSALAEKQSGEFVLLYG